MEARQQEPSLIAGRYELINAIASGGMATVYRGWDYRTDRYVAVKSLHGFVQQPADPFATQRFQREAQAVARIAHPNVVSVYDFVCDDQGQFLVMEYVDGSNLKHQVVDHGPLPIIRALFITEQVCAALAAAHACGLIHRDIKPQNILLANDGRIRLTDFGIVHIADSEGLTNSGIVLGTADYLSPEQAKGDPLSPVSDLYSLGIVLYEMLLGVPPFTAAKPILIALKHANDPVPALQASDPTIPSIVENVLRHAVAKDPRRRYRSAALMAKAVHDCRIHLQTVAQAATFEALDEPVVAHPVPVQPLWRRCAVPLRLLPHLKVKIVQ